MLWWQTWLDNFMDALNGWQPVKELKEATGLPAATSFKHVHRPEPPWVCPDDTLEEDLLVEDMESCPLAQAYARARGAGPHVPSFWGLYLLSDVYDVDTAKLIKPRGI